MEKLYLSKISQVDSEYHRSPIIIHRGFYYFAEFFNEEQLQEFLELSGLKFEFVESRKWSRSSAIYEEWKTETMLEDHTFSKISDIPTESKMFMGFSNGSIVPCYLLNDGKVLHIYRPNPNSKSVYITMPFEAEIEYIKNHAWI